MTHSHLQLELDHVIPPEPMFSLMSASGSFFRDIFIFHLKIPFLSPKIDNNLMDYIYRSICCTIIVSHILLKLSTDKAFFPLPV